MKSFYLPFNQLLVLISIFAAETKNGVVYYVSPTQPLSSCSGGSSCPPGELCHTIDYLSKHSSEFFSSDHVNVTLIFICGVHNHTNELTAQNLHSFAMKGAAESTENVIISHVQYGDSKCTLIQFFNISFVNITNLTMSCPSINMKHGFIAVKSCNLYGYPHITESLSFISITGKGSQALLDSCTFKENCFVTSNYSDGITVSDSTFRSYKHQTNSIIVALSSVVTLTGNVNFTDSVIGLNQPQYSSGTAVFLKTTHPELTSSLNITTPANVYFVNLTSNKDGGAVYGENAAIHVDTKVSVVFMYNAAGWFGGAVYVMKGMITVGAESCMTFTYNTVCDSDGGAVWLSNGTLVVDSEASLTFSHNSAGTNGGAFLLQNGQLIATAKANLNFNNNSAIYGGGFLLRSSVAHVGTDGINFVNNKGANGGALYFNYGTMYVNTNKTVTFIMNVAQDKGGAIFIETGAQPSIIVDTSSKILLFDNRAFQGGALYIMPSSFVITLGYQSSITFVNNAALDVGGAIYSLSSSPCIFMIMDYSAQVHFKGNHAERGVGHHMYGASVRAALCDGIHISLANKHGKPHCWHEYEVPDGYVNISFDPNLNETLSPVSSAPQRVCLCDSNGKPQCANISYIFTNISVYHGETIMLPTCIVGYDLGTTVGTIHARPLYSDSLSKRDKSQMVSDNEKCFPFNYTVHSKHDYELLLLQPSFLPASAYINNESTKDDIYKYKTMISGQISDYVSYNNHGCVDQELLTTPIFINISLLPGCPPGLTLDYNGTDCSCYPVLSNGFKCSVQNKRGLLRWKSTVWVNATFNGSHSNGIIYSHFCPLLYCKSGNKTVNIGDDPSKQCASNRAGILCGACTDNFSLAIGSSRCIECPSSHNVALLLFAFAAAGVFLVFFILALNLTVTQGLINGVIFYANIVWAYKIILFPSYTNEESNYVSGHISWIFYCLA